MSKKVETVEEFLARGGSVKQLPKAENRSSIDSRYKEKDLWRNDHNMQARVRIDNYKKKSGGRLPPDVVMYQKFAKKFLG